MGISILGIILFHCDPPFISVFTHFCGLWGVAIFLFLSGFGCAYALKKYSTGGFFYQTL